MNAIRPYTAEDRQPLTSLLVHAFRDDPGYRYAFPEHREQALTFLMPRLLDLRLESGSVRVCERDGVPVGTLTCSPSTTRFGMFAYLRKGLLRMPFQFGMPATRRMLQADSEVHALRNTVKPQQHHQYLAQIAVHPSAQGTGVGTALMRSFLEEDVDSSGQHAVLMTTKSENVLWYEGFGYTIAGQSGISSAFTAWCMVRPPQR